MMAIDQTIFGEGGNCYPACLATLFGVPLDRIPNFCALYKGTRWAVEAQRWLVQHVGVSFITLHVQEKDEEGVLPLPDGAVGILAGPAARGHHHAVVAKYRNGACEIIHDPHPSRAGLIKPVCFDFFVMMRPHADRGVRLIAPQLVGIPDRMYELMNELMLRRGPDALRGRVWKMNLATLEAAVQGFCPPGPGFPDLRGGTKGVLLGYPVVVQDDLPSGWIEFEWPARNAVPA